MASGEGLDHLFLRYTGVTPEVEGRAHRFYLPLFADCHRVAVLGCGYGSFVAQLAERGVTAIGVDRDPDCCEVARQQGGTIVCADAFDYLHDLVPGTIDGVFSAHLVEHLTYQQVLDLLRLCHRALMPGGRIVLVTPNVAALVSHLDLYYKHYDHVAFYHPELLSFLLDHAGFAHVETGENLSLARPFLGHIQLAPIAYDRLLPLPQDNPMRRAIRRIKMFAVHLVVQPYLDQIVSQINRNVAQLNELVDKLDRPFECYASAVRPPEEMTLP